MSKKRKLTAKISSLNTELTGSCTLVSVKFPKGKNVKFLVDFGSFLGKYDYLNNRFPFDVTKLAFVLLTHCHIDHYGRLIDFIIRGMKCPIYTSKISEEILKYLIANDYLAKHSDDIMDLCGKTLSKLALQNDFSSMDIKSRNFYKLFSPVPNIRCMFIKNGHMLGSAQIFVEISCKETGEVIYLLFTGDYNNKNSFFHVYGIPGWMKNLPITVITESTFGSFGSHKFYDEFDNDIKKALNEQKSIYIFSKPDDCLQEKLYKLKLMQQSGKLNKNIPIYIDGNLCIFYTKLFQKYSKTKFLNNMKDYLPDNVHLVNSEMHQKLLNSYDNNQKIVLTSLAVKSSYNYIKNKVQLPNVLLYFISPELTKSTIASVIKSPHGSQLRINQVIVEKKATIGYSDSAFNHALQDGLIRNLKQFKKLNYILLYHGSTKSKLLFKKKLNSVFHNTRCDILDSENTFVINCDGFVKNQLTKF